MTGGYLYESHMGGLYTAEQQIDFEYLYCETCGDSDCELGRYDNELELWELAKPLVSIDGSGGLYLVGVIENLFSGLFKEDDDIHNKSDKQIVAMIEEYVRRKNK